MIEILEVVFFHVILALRLQAECLFNMANVNFEILPYKEYYLTGWVIEVPNYAVVITKKVGDLRSETKGP